MGSFNLRGFFSNVSIQYGDEIVMMIGLQKKTNTRRYYTCEGIVPITLPIYGKYNDYGGIDSVECTPSSDWMETHLGKIDDVVRAVRECMSEFNQTIGECMSSDNECHPETKVRYVYDNLLKLKPEYINTSSRLCLLVEHRAVYEKYATPVKSNEYYSIENVLKEVDERRKTSVGLLRDSFMIGAFEDHSYVQRMFGNDSHKILCLMVDDNEEFIRDNIEEVKRLQGFILSMKSFGRSFQVPMQYSQCNYFKADLEYHKMCIDLIKTLKEEHDWYDDEDEEDSE